jgi:hypothetical protein
MLDVNDPNFLQNFNFLMQEFLHLKQLARSGNPVHIMQMEEVYSQLVALKHRFRVHKARAEAARAFCEGRAPFVAKL